MLLRYVDLCAFAACSMADCHILKCWILASYHKPSILCTHFSYFNCHFGVLLAQKPSAMSNTHKHIVRISLILYSPFFGHEKHTHTNKNLLHRSVFGLAFEQQISNILLLFKGKCASGKFFPPSPQNTGRHYLVEMLTVPDLHIYALIFGTRISRTGGTTS